MNVKMKNQNERHFYTRYTVLSLTQSNKKQEQPTEMLFFIIPFRLKIFAMKSGSSE